MGYLHIQNKEILTQQKKHLNDTDNKFINKINIRLEVML